MQSKFRVMLNYNRDVLMYGFMVKFVNTRTEILGRPVESEERPLPLLSQTLNTKPQGCKYALNPDPYVKP